MSLFRMAFGYGSSQGMRDKDGWISRIFGRHNSGLSNYQKNLATVYACRKQLCESMTLFPIDVIHKPNEKKRKKVDDHYTDYLLNVQPNSIMTASKFFQQSMLSLLDTGDSFAEIEFFPGSMRPKALWPIPSSAVTVQTYYNDNEIGIYYDVILPDGSIKKLSSKKMLHFVGMTENGFKGIGILDSANPVINLAENLQTYASNFFNHGSSGGGYLTLPAQRDPKAIQNMRKEMEEWNAGIHNAHRYKFLFDGITFAPDKISPDQAQFLQSRTFQVAEVARFYGMPLHKIQEGSKSSYASQEQAALEYVIYTLGCWIKVYEQEIQRKLFTDSLDRKHRVKFNVNALLRGDTAARANFYRTMVYIGAMTRNEVRAMEDLTWIKGADDLLVPTNLTLIELLAKEEAVNNNEQKTLSDKALDGQERTID